MVQSLLYNLQQYVHLTYPTLDSPSTSLLRPQSGSKEFPSRPHQALATVDLPGNGSTSASDAPGPPSGPVSLTTPITS